jgi:hypothetical protein
MVKKLVTLSGSRTAAAIPCVQQLPGSCRQTVACGSAVGKAHRLEIAAAAAAAAAGTVVGRVAAVAGRGPVGVGQLLQMELPLPADPGVPAGSSQLRRD